MDSTLKALGRLVGDWTTEATHPAMPGLTVHGTVSMEWLEGEQFLILRARTDHPEFPDSISIIGFSDHDRVGNAPSEDAAEALDQRLQMHYFDSRGVARVYRVAIDAATLRIERIAAGFSQRFRGDIADGGERIVGLWQLCEDDLHWHDDLAITYRRKPA